MFIASSNKPEEMSGVVKGPEEYLKEVYMSTGLRASAVVACISSMHPRASPPLHPARLIPLGSVIFPQANFSHTDFLPTNFPLKFFFSILIFHHEMPTHSTKCEFTT